MKTRDEPSGVVVRSTEPKGSELVNLKFPEPSVESVWSAVPSAMFSPFALSRSRRERPTTFAEALITNVPSICVTGVTVSNTWSPFSSTTGSPFESVCATW